MAYFTRKTYSVPIASAGGTYITTDTFNGYLNQINLRSNADFVSADVFITIHATSADVSNVHSFAGTAAQSIQPRAVTETQAGLDVTFNTSDKAYDRLALADDRLKFVCAFVDPVVTTMVFDVYVGD